VSGRPGYANETECRDISPLHFTGHIFQMFETVRWRETRETRDFLGEGVRDVVSVPHKARREDMATLPRAIMKSYGNSGGCLR